MNMDSISRPTADVARSGQPAAQRPRAAGPTREGALDKVERAQADAIRQTVARDTAEKAHEKAQLLNRVETEAARFEALNQALSFRVHDDSGELMVQVVDRNTGDVLRETPPKEFLDLAVRLQEMVGFFLDETR